jgi:hypothetical protein
MLRHIAYYEKALHQKITMLSNHIMLMDSEITMMEEQGLGLRKNLDWKSSGKTLRLSLEDIKETVNDFDVIPPIPFETVNFYTYDERIPEKIRRNFIKEHPDTKLKPQKKK